MQHAVDADHKNTRLHPPLGPRVRVQVLERRATPQTELLHELAQQVPVNGSGALQYEAFFDALHVVDCDRLSQVV